MLRLKRLTMRNWMSVADTAVDFPASGLVAVLGENQAGKGQLVSIGAGKTALGEALARMLFGMPGRFSTLSYCSRDEEGDMYLKLEAELGEQNWVVEYGYKCSELSSSGEGLRLTVDGSRIEHGHVRETRQTLVKALQLDASLAAWTTYLDGAKLRFDLLSQSQAVELVLSAMRQPPWHERQAKVKKAVDQAKLELTVVERNLTSTRDQLAAAAVTVTTRTETLRQAQSSFDAATSRYQDELQAWTDRAAQLKEALGTKAAELERYTAEWQTASETATAGQPADDPALAERLRTGQDTAEQWADAVAAARSALSAAISGHTSAASAAKTYAAGGRCAHCGHVSKQPDPAHLEILNQKTVEAEAAVAEARANLATAVESKTKADQYCALVRSKIDAAKAKRQAAIREATAQAVSNFHQAQSAHKSTDSQVKVHTSRKPVPPDSSLVTVAQTRLETATGQVTALETAVVKLGDDRTRWAQALAVADYWHKAFGPSGIPNLVLKTGIGALNQAAKLVSQAVAGGAVGLEFQTEVELAGGEAKPKLTTVAKQVAGSSRLAGGSKGEQGLANLLAAEALTVVAGNPVGFRWLDEAVNSQDYHVRRQVYQYLRRQAVERRLLTFVVDHHPDLEASADHVLIATKDQDGKTTYRWR